MIEAPPRTRVLHVVESFGAGVVSALGQYVLSTPELEHHLLRSQRPDFVDEGELASFASVTTTSRRPLGAMRDLRRVLRDIRPDVVHAHSSLAGALVRLTVRRSKAVRIIYTPHGFASERRDLGRLTRRAFEATEWLLSWNTDVLAACSMREHEIAERGHAGAVVFVPNVPGSGLAEKRRPPEAGRVVGVGRVTAQKDPAFFLDVVEALRGAGASVEPVWVGGGSAELSEMLVDRGIHVTGWLPRSEALGVVAGAEVYLHTSAWDSGPMTLLEAVAMGVPAVARRVPSLPGLPQEVSAVTPAELAAMVQPLLGAGVERDRNLEAWEGLFALHSPVEQRRKLLGLYEPHVEEGA